MGICTQLDHCFNSPFKRWVAIVLGIIELFWFSGYHYGFNSLIGAYKDAGVFSENCISDESPCNQDNLFGTGFIVWIVCQLCLIPFSGLIMDRIGLRFLKIVSVLCFVVGTFMFAFTRMHFSALYFPAGILVGLGSTSTLICNHQISSMFPNNRGIVISLFSGAFDSSCIITFIIAKRYKEFSLQNTFIILAICSLLLGIFIALFILTEKSTDMGNFYKNKTIDREDQEESESMVNVKIKRDVNSQIEKIIDTKYPTLKSCLTSFPFFLVTLWFTCGMFRFSTYLAGLVKQLDYLFPNDKDQRANLLQLSSAFMLSGILAAPITGLIIDASHAYFKKRIVKLYETSNDSNLVLSVDSKVYINHVGATAPGFFIMALLAIGTSVLILFPNKYAIYVSFLLFVILRSFLFTSFIGFCLTSFPIKHFGTVNAIINCIAGIFSLLQYALILTTVPTYNIISIIVSAGILVSPIILFYQVYKN